MMLLWCFKLKVISLFWKKNLQACYISDFTLNAFTLWKNNCKDELNSDLFNIFISTLSSFFGCSAVWSTIVNLVREGSKGDRVTREVWEFFRSASPRFVFLCKFSQSQLKVQFIYNFKIPISAPINIINMKILKYRNFENFKQNLNLII